MRTKLFLAFFAVILTALVSNFLFERMIVRDFEDYTLGAREDRLYWLLASVEGSFEDSGWDKQALKYYLQYSTMLGFEAIVKDLSGNLVLDTKQALKGVSGPMLRRMGSIVEIDKPAGEFDDYPLFVNDMFIGTLSIRLLTSKGILKDKENVFIKRLQEFLIISFLIAGAGAVFLSIVFSLFLTVPIKRLKQAAEGVTGGDLSVRVKGNSKDEVGELCASFNRMVETLQREEALRIRLTSNIAHELRTPLTVMKAHIEAVKDGVLPATEDAVDSLNSEVQRLINLVEGIEDMTKAEASFFKKAEYVDVSVSALLESILSGIRPLFVEKGIDIVFHVNRECIINTDAEKLEIILRNILSNALKFTDRGTVTISCGKTDGRVFIEVKDTGRGISDTDLELVFKRFYKGIGSTGTGLGLSISKELVGLLGGEIVLASKAGEGAAVRVLLPMT